MMTHPYGLRSLKNRGAAGAQKLASDLAPGAANNPSATMLGNRTISPRDDDEAASNASHHDTEGSDSSFTDGNDSDGDSQMSDLSDLTTLSELESDSDESPEDVPMRAAQAPQTPMAHAPFQPGSVVRTPRKLQRQNAMPNIHDANLFRLLPHPSDGSVVGLGGRQPRQAGRRTQRPLQAEATVLDEEMMNMPPSEVATGSGSSYTNAEERQRQERSQLRLRAIANRHQEQYQEVRALECIQCMVSLALESGRLSREMYDESRAPMTTADAIVRN
ncbi:hypothetical protein EVG20_g6783, partial [Dentipellis fragilis]